MLDVRELTGPELDRLREDLEGATAVRFAVDTDGLKWSVHHGMWTIGRGTDPNKRDDGSAAVLLLAGLPVVALAVALVARLAGAIAGVS